MPSDTNENKNTKGRFLIIVFLLISAALIFILINKHKDKQRDISYKAISTGKLVEKRETLSPKSFSGDAAYAYKLAQEIPEIIDKQFCYCQCKKEHGHKTLLTCFVTDHGEKCDLCIKEVIMANDLLRDGLSVDEITQRIDDKFSKIAKEHTNHF